MRVRSVQRANECHSWPSCGISDDGDADLLLTLLCFCTNFRCVAIGRARCKRRAFIFIMSFRSCTLLVGSWKMATWQWTMCTVVLAISQAKESVLLDGYMVHACFKHATIINQTINPPKCKWSTMRTSPVPLLL